MPIPDLLNSALLDRKWTRRRNRFFQVSLGVTRVMDLYKSRFGPWYNLDANVVWLEENSRKPALAPYVVSVSTNHLVVDKATWIQLLDEDTEISEAVRAAEFERQLDKKIIPWFDLFTDTASVCNFLAKLKKGSSPPYLIDPDAWTRCGLEFWNVP